MIARIIAIVNQKGGVGKTTTCVNLCAALTEKKKKVLLCDLDPQGNSTSGMGIEKNEVETVYELLLGSKAARDVIIQTEYGDVMPSNKVLAGAEVELVAADKREYVLKSVFSSVQEEYDYIIIDCPPSLGLLTTNALCAANSVIVPVQCEYYALEGLQDLVFTIRVIKKGLNPSIDIEGILLTMYDPRTNLSQQVAREVKNVFPGKVYNTVIPRNVRLSEAPSYGKPVIAYDRSSKGADCYIRLAAEILKKERKKSKKG